MRSQWSGARFAGSRTSSPAGEAALARPERGRSLRRRGEVRLHPGTVCTVRLAAVVLDQRAAVAPCIPRPGGVADPVRVPPPEDRRDDARAAIRAVVRLPRLAQDQG